MELDLWHQLAVSLMVSTERFSILSYRTIVLQQVAGRGKAGVVKIDD